MPIRGARAMIDGTAGDLEGFRSDFLKIFGFNAEGVDYDADVSPVV